MPRSAEFAAYIIGVLMEIIFVLLDSIAVSGSKALLSWENISIYDHVWFQSISAIQLVLIYLICQFIFPVGFILLVATYVRHKRYNCHLANIYNLIPTKWKYLEASLIIFAGGIIYHCVNCHNFRQNITLTLGRFILSAQLFPVFLKMIVIKLPPREAHGDLK
ncbi:hypothetical protein ATZ36_00420 [Candidatus Endomicrobiellum trichonymphae]|uniref:Uncharacterized protein n=1 Tax=Endomicrobium trichonymphae TaxID=1408204 RepID=A0A1E5IKD7_ENDTX|nr:hypothetical protein ATZ36_00420 [Candidatus Endomicrobium trichonymphae]